MKKLLGSVCLSILALSVSAHTTDDIRPLFPNEIPLQDLPKFALKSSYSRLSSSTKAKSSTAVADVVIFYQPSFAAKYGKREAFKRVSAWVDLANRSYALHNLDYALNVKDIVAVTSVSDDVPWLDVVDEDGNIIQDGADYIFSGAVLNAGNTEYEIYQQKWKADFVIYVREQREGDYILGAAGVGGESSTVLDDGSEPRTYSTLAHEVGHNIGMNHENGDANAGPEYARAWECGGQRTIMYSSSSATLSDRHYSSPDLSRKGEVCGNAETANNARVLEENFVQATQRRSGVESLGSVTFDQAAFNGNEVDGVTITLVRDGDLTEGSSVKVFAEDETALLGRDYTETYVLAEFEAGSATTQVTYPIIADSDSEGAETFTVHLRFPYKLTISDDENLSTISITDNAQVGNVGLFSISGPSEINEGDTTEYIVSRNGGVGDAVLNVQSINDTAFADQDFVALNQDIVFGEGEVQKTIELVTLNNAIGETTERFSIVINNASDTAEYDVKSIVVNLIDNDVIIVPEIGTFAINTDQTTVSESAGNIIINVVRSNGSDGVAVVRLRTVGGSALAGEDYTDVFQEITFADGEIQKTINIPILDDTKDEPGTTSFNVVLESSTVEVTTGSVTITLTDNDDAPVVTPPVVTPPVVTPPASESGGGSTGMFFILFLGFFAFIRGREVDIKTYR
jgi:hypothetical protein